MPTRIGRPAADHGPSLRRHKVVGARGWSRATLRICFTGRLGRRVRRGWTRAPAAGKLYGAHRLTREPTGTIFRESFESMRALVRGARCIMSRNSCWHAATPDFPMKVLETAAADVMLDPTGFESSLFTMMVNLFGRGSSLGSSVLLWRRAASIGGLVAAVVHEERDGCVFRALLHLWLDPRLPKGGNAPSCRWTAKDVAPRSGWQSDRPCRTAAHRPGVRKSSGRADGREQPYESVLPVDEVVEFVGNRTGPLETEKG